FQKFLKKWDDEESRWSLRSQASSREAWPEDDKKADYFRISRIPTISDPPASFTTPERSGEEHSGQFGGLVVVGVAVEEVRCWSRLNTPSRYASPLTTPSLTHPSYSPWGDRSQSPASSVEFPVKFSLKTPPASPRHEIPQTAALFGPPGSSLLRPPTSSTAIHRRDQREQEERNRQLMKEAFGAVLLDPSPFPNIFAFRSPIFMATVPTDECRNNPTTAPRQMVTIDGDARGSSSSSTTPPNGNARAAGGLALSGGLGRQVVYTDLGDPVTSVHIGEWGLAAGTMLGKVWYYSLELDERIPLAGFSDDAVKAVFVRDSYTEARRRDREAGVALSSIMSPPSEEKLGDLEEGLRHEDLEEDEVHPSTPIVYATVGDSCAKIFDTADPCQQSVFKFERRSSASVKYVVQRQNKVAIVFPGMTTFIDLVTESQNMTPFRLQGTDEDVTMACPTDMNDLILLLVEHYDVKLPCYKVVDLEHDQQVLDSAPLPGRGRLCHFVRILGPSHLVFVSEGRNLGIYDFRLKKVEHVLKEHRGDILSVDTTFSDDEFVSVDTRGEVRLWNAAEGKLLAKGRLPKACDFALGFPYYVSYCPRTGVVAQTCDSGVFALQLKSLSRPGQA
ncbi:hypothetical protein FOZ62_024248, partial [Perkinsus olseni]